MPPARKPVGDTTMPSYVCNSTTCKFLKQGANASLPADKKQPFRVTFPLAKKNLQCIHCKARMADDVDAPTQQPATNAVGPHNLNTAMEAVDNAEPLKERVQFVKGVKASLLTADSHFQDEFIKDMKNPLFVKEFVSGPRQTDKGVVCVDSALRVCGLASPRPWSPWSLSPSRVWTLRSTAASSRRCRRLSRTPARTTSRLRL